MMLVVVGDGDGCTKKRKIIHSKLLFFQRVFNGFLLKVYIHTQPQGVCDTLPTMADICNASGVLLFLCSKLAFGSHTALDNIHRVSLCVCE